MLSLHVNNAIFFNFIVTYIRPRPATRSWRLRYKVRTTFASGLTPESLVGRVGERVPAEAAWNRVQNVISGKVGVQAGSEATSRQLIDQVLAGEEGVLWAQRVTVESSAQGS